MSTPPHALTLHGAARDLFHCQRREVVLSGSAGTGKSVSCCVKLHVLCSLIPNLRCLMVRKTRESLSESALVTFEQKVVPPGHPILNGQQRRTRQNYTYPNGSQIILGGMDKPSKIMSTEYDLIYTQEAIELTIDDWEALTTRLRNGRLPYQQILADTNPDTPTHWIKQREAEGKLLLLESRHEDNPRLYSNGRWTPDGLAYLATLDQLTGPRLQRLRYGRWVQAEGAVYDTFDRAVHVVDARWWSTGIPPAEWPRYWAIDFGYIHPFVCLWGAVDSDGRLWVYNQHIATQRLVEDHAKVMLHELAMEERTLKLRANAMRRDKIKELGEEATARWFVEQMETIPGMVKPRAILCDHDAEDRATLQRHLGMQTTAAYKAIGQGIQAVQSRLRVQGDGKPRLLIGRDSVMARDPAMKAASLPIGLAEEFEGYVWDTRMGRKKGEEPLDKGNHTCFVAGTLVDTDRGREPIETLTPGRMVWTRGGLCEVVAAGCTSEAAEVFEVAFSNGETLIGTGNHPVFVQGKGFVPLSTLAVGDAIQGRGATCLQGQSLEQSRSWSSSTGFGSGGIRILRDGLTGCTSCPTRTTASGESAASTRKSGRTRTGRFRRAGTCTTRTATRSTMPWTTWSACPRVSIFGSTVKSRCRLSGSTICATWHYRGRWKQRKRGTPARRALPGIGSTLARWLRSGRPTGCRGSVSIAALSSRRTARLLETSDARRGSAPTTVGHTLVPSRAWMTSNGVAPGAANCSVSTSTPPSDTAPVRVQRVRMLPDVRPVFNLTVAASPEYYANGVLVHNCDAVRYMVAALDVNPRKEVKVW